MKQTSLLPWSRNKRNVQPRDDDSGVFELQSAINRAFETFWNGFSFPVFADWSANGLGGPLLRVDVRETEQDVTVTAELPGISERDVDVSVADGLLTIRGEAQSEREAEEDTYIIHERSVGKLFRVVPLPEGLDLDAAQAKLKNGLLTVSIPKTANAKAGARRIAVKRA